LKDPYGNPHIGSATIASLAVSFLVIYGLNISGFDLSYYLSLLGSSEISWILIPSIIIISILFFISRFGRKKFAWFLVISGISLLALSTTDIFWEKVYIVLAGIVLLAIGILLLWRGRGLRAGSVGLVKKSWNITKGGGNMVKEAINKKRAEKQAWEKTIRDKKIEANIENVRINKGREEEEIRQQYAQQEKLKKEQRKREKIAIKAHQENLKRQKGEEDLQKQKSIKKENKLALARKLGINKLGRQHEDLRQQLQKGIQRAAELHSQSTNLGWNKTKEGNKYYKAWFRQYNQNIQDEKKLKEIESRIQHLQGKV